MTLIDRDRRVHRCEWMMRKFSGAEKIFIGRKIFFITPHDAPVSRAKSAHCFWPYFIRVFLMFIFCARQSRELKIEAAQKIPRFECSRMIFHLDLNPDPWKKHCYMVWLNHVGVRSMNG
ncbi:hypothetical protein LLG95_15395 [bacterium]|nr:hypothetical protein [bacterium]